MEEGRSVKTTVTAGKVKEPQKPRVFFDYYDKNALELAYECECGERAARSTPTWCDHAVAVLTKMIDPYAGEARPGFHHHKVRLKMLLLTTSSNSM